MGDNSHISGFWQELLLYKIFETWHDATPGETDAKQGLH